MGALLALVLGATSLATSFGPKPAAAAPSASRSRIAFSADRRPRYGRYAVYVADPDGSHQRRITPRSWLVSDPDLSPAGTRVAFARQGAGDEIYVANVDGSQRRRITRSPGMDGQAQWSPDGTRLAFVSDRSGRDEIWTMNPDGSGLVQVTTSSAGYRSSPSWSPDGSQLVFAEETTTPAPNPRTSIDLVVIDADGTDRRVVAATDAYERNPSWSPDGSVIAFDSCDQGHDGGIYTVKPDGSARTRLTAIGHDPDWSPDGRRLVFAVDSVRCTDVLFDIAFGYSEIRVIDADGTDENTLALAGVERIAPSWGTVQPAPANLTATPSRGSVTLSWSTPIPTSHFSGYLIQRSADGGPWRTIATRTSRATRHVARGLRVDAQYRFRVVTRSGSLVGGAAEVGPIG